MNCPACSGEIIQNPNVYVCRNCGFRLRKRIADVFITPEIAEELFKNGQTRVIHNFYSYKKRKQFSASLVIKKGQVTFKYPGQENSKHAGDNQSSVRSYYLRIQANNSGSVYMGISGPVNKKTEIDYGLAPVALAEFYGCLTGIQFIRHHESSLKNTKLKISLNNKDAASYILHEKTPKKKDIKNTLTYLQSHLHDFPAWEVHYQRMSRPQLTGGQKAVKFPHGVFPWLNAKVTHEEGSLTVVLPESPDLTAQFKASLYKAQQLDKNTFKMPVAAKEALNAWLVTVKNGESKSYKKIQGGKN